jgi:hypothetical protein
MSFDCTARSDPAGLPSCITLATLFEMPIGIAYMNIQSRCWVLCDSCGICALRIVDSWSYVYIEVGELLYQRLAWLSVRWLVVQAPASCVSAEVSSGPLLMRGMNHEGVRGECALQCFVTDGGLLACREPMGSKEQLQVGQALTSRSDMMSSISAGAGTVRGVELQKGSGSRSVKLGSVFSLVTKSGLVDEDAAMATGAMWVRKNGRLVAAVEKMAVQTTNGRMRRRCKQWSTRVNVTLREWTMRVACAYLGLLGAKLDQANKSGGFASAPSSCAKMTLLLLHMKVVPTSLGMNVCYLPRDCAVGPHVRHVAA